MHGLQLWRRRVQRVRPVLGSMRLSMAIDRLSMVIDDGLQKLKTKQSSRWHGWNWEYSIWLWYRRVRWMLPRSSEVKGSSVAFGFHTGEYAGRGNGHQRCRSIVFSYASCSTWSSECRERRILRYTLEHCVWHLEQESTSCVAAAIGGGGINGIRVTRLVVDFGVWHKIVCQARSRSSEVEESGESGLHAWSWILVFGTREYARWGPCSSEVEELTKWGVCGQAWALAKEITGECTPERGHWRWYHQATRVFFGCITKMKTQQSIRWCDCALDHKEADTWLAENVVLGSQGASNEKHTCTGDILLGAKCWK